MAHVTSSGLVLFKTGEPTESSFLSQMETTTSNFAAEAIISMANTSLGAEIDWVNEDVSHPRLWDIRAELAQKHLTRIGQEMPLPGLVVLKSSFYGGITFRLPPEFNPVAVVTGDLEIQKYKDMLKADHLGTESIDGLLEDIDMLGSSPPTDNEELGDKTRLLEIQSHMASLSGYICASLGLYYLERS